LVGGIKSNIMINNKRVLIIAAQERNLAPGQRFRFEQYTDFLEANGFTCELSPLADSKDLQTLYSKNNYFAKFKLLYRAYRKRKTDLRKVKNKEFDLVFVFREAMIGRFLFFEKKVKASGTPMIFDFDDSIWLQDVSDANKKFSWLKNPQKTSKIIKLCHLVITGNEYLRNYSLQYNQNTIIIPTTIDTSVYQPLKKNFEDISKPITIGWSGSITTIKHFRTALGFLYTLKQKYGDKLSISVIGDKNYTNDELGIFGKAWHSETELKDLCEFDIGIMPLPDDEWAKGKCGLKGLQYMALEIPTVMSPVGVNTEIITDGVNGYLASTEEEWIEKLSLLIESEELRKKLGKASRQTVVDKYSVDANKHKWVEAFHSALKI